MSKPRVTLLGLGLMGSGMAKSLLRAGYPLTIFNRSRDKTAPFAELGAQIADSSKTAAAQSDVLVSMVADDVASRNVWLGERGALAGLTPGTVLIEASTLSLPWVNELAAAASQVRCDLLDAPVTGSRTHAAAGELCFLVGGSAEVLERARPVLQTMSRAIVHLGPQGSGCLMKIINNFVCGVQAAVVAEAITLIERSGLDPEKAAEVLANGAPGSPLLKTVLPRMSQRSYEPHFHLELMAKDLTYAREEGKRHQLDLKTVAAALELFNAAKTGGLAHQDFSAVIEPLRKS